MPLRTVYKLCPQAIFVEDTRHSTESIPAKCTKCCKAFSPLVEMASVDEAYLDVTGSERLYGPPLKAAQLLHVESAR
jgi:DNA polymerase IV